MRELTEHDKALIIDSIPSSDLVLFCLGLQGRGNTLIDRSQYANHGAITGATWKRLPSGLMGLSLDGISNKVLVTNSASLKITAALTLMAWVKPDDVAGTRTIISKGNGVWWTGAYPGYELRINVGSIEFTINDGANTDQLTYGFTTTSKYSLITAVFDGDYMYIYVGADLVASKNTALTAIGTDDDNVSIGYQAGHDLFYFDGDIFIPVILNSALVPTRIYTRQRHLFGV